MPHKIYIVEDDSAIRNVLEMILTDAGYEALAFENFKGLKKQIELVLPDLILMDMTLQEGNGITFCEELKAAESTAKTPILMMSAHFILNPEEEIPCADGFISKPFDVDDLLSTVGKYVS